MVWMILKPNKVSPKRLQCLIGNIGQWQKPGQFSFASLTKKPRTIDGQDDQGVQQAYPSQDVVGADVSGVSIQTMLVANEGPLNVMGLKTLVE